MKFYSGGGWNGRAKCFRPNGACCHSPLTTSEISFCVTTFTPSFQFVIAANRCNSASLIRIFLKSGTRLSLFCRINFLIETTLTDRRAADSRTSKRSFGATFAAGVPFPATASDLASSSILVLINGCLFAYSATDDEFLSLSRSQPSRLPQGFSSSTRQGKHEQVRHCVEQTEDIGRAFTNQKPSSSSHILSTSRSRKFFNKLKFRS